VGCHFTILVADRNRHVREFLRRELLAEGYGVDLAKDDHEVLARMATGAPPDLLILDLELPCMGGVELLERLRKQESPVPVLIHSFLPENGNHPAIQDTAGFVEKSGDNIYRFKTSVAEVLRKTYPHRFASKETEEPILKQGHQPAG
jgi:CheY-like chemotaxis protein